MPDFYIHRERILPPSDIVPQTCWLAREIFASYMDVGFGVEESSSEPDSQLPEYGESSGTISHDTVPVLLNDNQQASLGNLPYLEDASGEHYLFTEPGYVALTIDTLHGESTDPTQFIFQLPVEGKTAAIFEGFDFQPAHQIDPTHKEKVQRIRQLLKFMQDTYRRNMETPDEFRMTYHGNVPRTSSFALLEQDFADLGD